MAIAIEWNAAITIIYSLVTLGIAVSAILLGTYTFTTIRYHWAIRKGRSSKIQKPHLPIQIPFSIPWLGNTRAFLAPRPGQFWSQLFRWHPRATGACTLLLGGRATRILYNPHAVQHLFKARGPTRDEFLNDIWVNALGTRPSSEVKLYYGPNEPADETGFTPTQQVERFTHDTLLRTDRVNELTADFLRFLKPQLDECLALGSEQKSEEVKLYAWLRSRMFRASTTAFFGERLPEMFPGLEEDFFQFDRYILHMFFGLPKFLVPEAYEARERILANFTEYLEAILKTCDGKIPSPDNEDSWDPLFGSRHMRAHYQYDQKRGLLMRTRACIALGTMFGQNSNAIPATGWMLMHILNPEIAGGDPTLYPRILEEIKKAQRGDGSIDIPILMNQPLLLSTFHEVLRLYTDALVTRTMHKDMELPLEESSDGKITTKSFLVKKNDIIMAPSWLGHRDENSWTTHPSDRFFAERFLTPSDPKDPSSEPVFSTNGTAGKFFPFGAGKTICPGRVFAKQEVLATVALILLELDFEVLGFVDAGGKQRKKDETGFPGLRDSFLGSGIMVTDGDFRVRMKRRQP